MLLASLILCERPGKGNDSGIIKLEIEVDVGQPTKTSLYEFSVNGMVYIYYY